MALLFRLIARAHIGRTAAEPLPEPEPEPEAAPEPARRRRKKKRRKRLTGVRTLGPSSTAQYFAYLAIKVPKEGTSSYMIRICARMHAFIIVNSFSLCFDINSKRLTRERYHVTE